MSTEEQWVAVDALAWRLANALAQLNDWPTNGADFCRAEAEYEDAISLALSTGALVAHGRCTWLALPPARAHEGALSVASLAEFLGVQPDTLARHLGFIAEASPIPAAMKEARAAVGVSRDEIVAVFPPLKRQTDEQWKNMLRDGRAKWLKPARLDAGRSGIQSRWNPARLAICLAEQQHMQRRQLGILMSKYFPEYLPEWETYAGSFKS